MLNFKIFTYCFLSGLMFFASTSFSQTAEELYQKGVQLEEIQGNLNEAIETFTKAIKKNPPDNETSALAQLHIGLCYEKLGEEKLADAVSSFKKVISLHPSQKYAVQIAREKLASLDTNENAIQEIKNSIAECDKAYESKDFESYVNFFSNQYLSSNGGIDKERENIVNNYFSKWKTLSVVSNIKSIDKSGYNYVVHDEVNFTNTDWEGNKKSEEGVNRFLTFTKEDGKWKILDINYQYVPATYKKLHNNYPGIGTNGFCYVTHITQNFVSVINTKTDSLVGIINSGYGSCDITFSKERGYIANFNSDDITVFNKNDNTKIASVPVGNHPAQIIITNDGKYALITHQSSDGLWIMSTKDNQIVNKIPEITGIPVYDSANNKIYFSIIFKPYVYAFNPDNQTIIKKIEVGGRPLNIDVTPDGKFLYVANFDLNNVQKIDTQTDSLVSIISNIDSSRGIGISPDGKFAYVTNILSNKVTVIDLNTDTIIKTISVGAMPTSVAINKENNCVYISNQGEPSVSVIDISKNEVIKTIPVANNPINVRIY